MSIRTAFDAFTQAIVAKLKTVIVNDNNHVLEFGGRYFINGDFTVTLPYIADRTEDSAIYLDKKAGAVVILQTNDDSSRIVLNGVFDTHLKYDVARPVKIVYQGSTGRWLV